MHITQDIQNQTRVNLQLSLTSLVSIRVLMVYLLILISPAVMGSNSPEVYGSLQCCKRSMNFSALRLMTKIVYDHTIAST